MKKWNASTISLVMSICTAVCSNSWGSLTPFVAPPTGESTHTAATNALGRAHQKSTLEVGSATNFIGTIRSVLMVPPSSSVALASEDILIADAKAGQLKSSSFGPDGSGYAVSDGTLSWSNLVYGQSASWTNPIMAELIELDSVAEADDTALADVMVTSWSSDGNVLGDSLNFAGLDYTSRALAIKTDGTEVTSGPTTGVGVRVLAVAFMKEFNGGDTPAGLDQVDNWVTSFGPDYTVRWTLQTADGAITLFEASARVGGIKMPRPVLSIQNQTGTVTIRATNATTNSAYRLYGAASLSGPWKSYPNLVSTNSVTIPADKNALFFKAAMDAQVQ